MGIGYVLFAPWVFESYGLLPAGVAYLSVLAGGISPTVAAVLVARHYYGERSRGLFDAFKRPATRVTFVAAVVIPVCMFYVEAALATAMGVPYNILRANIVAVPLVLIGMWFMNVWEEVGWRGIALPALQGRHSALVSGLAVGAVWAAWHLPHFMVRDSDMARVYGGFPQFFAIILASSVVYAWLYNNSNGNLMVASLYHAAGNAIGTIVLVDVGAAPPVIAALVVVLTIAAVLVVAFGAGSLSRDGRVTLDDIMVSVPS